LQSSRLLAHSRLTLLLFSILIYLFWLLTFSLLLCSQCMPESFWRSLYTAVLSSLTIQTADYNDMGDEAKLLTLACTTLSLQLACLVVFFLVGYYRKGGEGVTGGKLGPSRLSMNKVGDAEAALASPLALQKDVVVVAGGGGVYLPAPLPHGQRMGLKVVVEDCGEGTTTEVRSLSPYEGEVGRSGK